MQPLALQGFEPLVARRFDLGGDAVDFAVHHMMPLSQLHKVRIGELQLVQHLGIVRKFVVHLMGGVCGHDCLLWFVGPV